jgi:hypothetical protein
MALSSRSGIEGKDGFDLLALFNLGGCFGDRFAAQLLDALGKHLGMAHFIDGDQFDILGQFAVIHVVQIVVLVHVLGDGMQLHPPGFVQYFDNLCPSCISCRCVHKRPPLLCW